MDLDAASRHAAQLAPPPASKVAVLEPLAPMGAAAAAAQPSTQPGVPLAPASLEDLMPGLVRKVAWSGDARNGTLRLELGSGALAGATLLVQSTAGRVDVTLGSSSGSSHTRGELEAWRDRIAARLEARGLDVGAIDVA